MFANSSPLGGNISIELAGTYVIIAEFRPFLYPPFFWFTPILPYSVGFRAGNLKSQLNLTFVNKMAYLSLDLLIFSAKSTFHR